MRGTSRRCLRGTSSPRVIQWSRRCSLGQVFPRPAPTCIGMNPISWGAEAESAYQGRAGMGLWLYRFGAVALAGRTLFVQHVNCRRARLV